MLYKRTASPIVAKPVRMVILLDKVVDIQAALATLRLYPMQLTHTRSPD
jgi:hypothetical protein